MGIAVLDTLTAMAVLAFVAGIGESTFRPASSPGSPTPSPTRTAPSHR